MSLVDVLPIVAAVMFIIAGIIVIRGRGHGNGRLTFGTTASDVSGLDEAILSRSYIPALITILTHIKWF